MLPLAGAQAQTSVMMNEIYSRGVTGDPDWIELFNNSATPADIGGYKIYDNGGQAGTKPKKEIPAGTTIPAWGVLVIVTDDGAADGFGLSSGGEEVWLEDNTGKIIDDVTFASMQTTETYKRYPDGGAWKLSAGLTRGYINTIFRMNEIYSRGVTGDPDWIEIYNASPVAYDLAKYKIYDVGGQTGTKPKKLFPAGSAIAANGVFVIVTDDGTADAFGLSSGGEKVWLEDSSGVVIDSVAFASMQTTESYSRIPDGGVWQLVPTITRGLSNTSSTGIQDQATTVNTFRLGQNYPNPFNPTTQIEFVLPKTAQVRVTIHNLLGQMVREVINAQMAAGTHRLTIDAADLHSGVYFYTIRTADYTATKRMVVMK